MNELHDDIHLRLLELNRINALLDKSLDYALELSHGGNREKHEITIDKDKDKVKDMHVNRYTDIKNDKLDLVNEIGEFIDSYMSDAYNIVDGINKSHNNSSAYDILAENLKKSKDTILKMINSSNVCAKQDTKKNDADNVNVSDKQDIDNDKADTNNNNDKPDTKVKDKSDTKVKDKPGTKVKDEPDTKVKGKTDTKVKDKEDIESSASKNEP